MNWAKAGFAANPWGVRSASSTRKKRTSSTRKKRTSSTRKKRTSSTRKAKRPARLVKGSAAAKRYMASIRKRRKK